jgi:hypothetical protein
VAKKVARERVVDDLGDVLDIAHRDRRALGVALGRHQAHLQVGQAGGLDHAQRALDALLGAVAAAHLAQQTRGHSREGHAEVGLGADLLDVCARPAGLAREHVELHQQRGLAGAGRIGVALLMLWICCRSGFG